MPMPALVSSMPMPAMLMTYLYFVSPVPFNLFLLAAWGGGGFFWRKKYKNTLFPVSHTLPLHGMRRLQNNVDWHNFTTLDIVDRAYCVAKCNLKKYQLNIISMIILIVCLRAQGPFTRVVDPSSFHPEVAPTYAGTWHTLRIPGCRMAHLIYPPRNY
jgi:hypothetical protein